MTLKEATYTQLSNHLSRLIPGRSKTEWRESIDGILNSDIIINQTRELVQFIITPYVHVSKCNDTATRVVYGMPPRARGNLAKCLTARRN